MVTLRGYYQGDKQVRVQHGPSGVELTTDAPLDNFGKGSSFSPSDLVAGALGACMLTVMAIVAERHQWSLAGAHFEVEKHMSSTPPRRIVELPISLHLPSALEQSAREVLERTAHTCPVHQSLHPDIAVEVRFVYDVG